MSEPNGPAFKVVLAESVKQQVSQLHDAAEGHGLGQRFIEALKIVNEALRRDPTGFGDPVFRLPGLELAVFV
jgi:hypothetical protein